MRYLEDIERFKGTGERDANGLSLEEFLDSYNPRKFDSPCNTVDMLVFRSEEPYERKDQPLKLLMIRRKNHPGIGFWALPGGFAEVREDLLDSARRELFEETGVKDIPLIQLRTWGAYDRDPRWRIITTAYLALVSGELPEHAGDDAADAAWFDASLEEEPGTAVTGAAGAAERIYLLRLVNAERGITLSARVKRTDIPHGILMDKQYEQLESTSIAADHPLLIADALLYLYALAR